MDKSLKYIFGGLQHRLRDEILGICKLIVACRMRAGLICKSMTQYIPSSTNH